MKKIFNPLNATLNTTRYQFFNKLKNLGAVIWIYLFIASNMSHAQQPGSLNEIDKAFINLSKNKPKNQGDKQISNRIAADNTVTSFCDDPGFENSTTISWANWHGYYGQSSPSNQGFGVRDFNCSNTSSNNINTAHNWVSGLIQSGNTTCEYPNYNTSTCPITISAINNVSTQIHHKIQNAGNDPILGTLLPTTHSGNRSLRLGNAVINCGIEKVEKRFVVTPSTQKIGFSYAVVMGNPCLDPCTAGHFPRSIPSFIVQIRDETNIANPYHLNNLVNLGNNDNFVTNLDQILIKTLAYTIPCDPNNPPIAGNEMAYKPWSYVEINLPNSLLGKTVNIEFITRDCGHTGHFCYAYLDDFCSAPDATNPSGHTALGISDSCGLKGKICVNYNLPKTGTTTGTVKFTLNTITAGGTVMNTPISSPVLTTGDSYCFDISNLGTINPPAFDYYITADYTLSGGSLPQQIIGSTVSGVKAGLNNDYKINCTPDIVFDPCCPPMNAELMRTLFKFTPTGGINDPYKIEFTPTAFFKNSSQAYCDYIHALYPNIGKLTFSWELRKADCSIPKIFYSQPVGSNSTIYNWFIPNGNGTLNSQTNFFNESLNINECYAIHVGIFTEPDSKAFAKECSNNTLFYFKIIVMNGMRKVTIGDGKKTVAEYFLEPSNKKN